jgi:hypothetical protein
MYIYYFFSFIELKQRYSSWLMLQQTLSKLSCSSADDVINLLVDTDFRAITPSLITDLLSVFLCRYRGLSTENKQQAESRIMEFSKLCWLSSPQMHEILKETFKVSGHNSLIYSETSIKRSIRSVQVEGSVEELCFYFLNERDIIKRIFKWVDVIKDSLGTWLSERGSECPVSITMDETKLVKRKCLLSDYNIGYTGDPKKEEDPDGQLADLINCVFLNCQASKITLLVAATLGSTVGKNGTNFEELIDKVVRCCNIVFKQFSPHGAQLYISCVSTDFGSKNNFIRERGYNTWKTLSTQVHARGNTLSSDFILYCGDPLHLVRYSYLYLVTYVLCGPSILVFYFLLIILGEKH